MSYLSHAIAFITGTLTGIFLMCILFLASRNAGLSLRTENPSASREEPP